MNTIRFLNENSLEALTKGNISYTHVPSLDCYILNYNQIPNPTGFDKFHPVTRECRNLVLRRTPEGWVVLAKSFERFFNWDEDPEATKLFIQKLAEHRVIAREKLDGSLILVSNIDGRWQIFTRSTFADNNPFRGIIPSANDADNTFAAHVRKYLDESKLELGMNYVFELCTPSAHITKYTNEFLALLSVNDNTIEYPIDAVDFKSFEKFPGAIRLPESFMPNSIEEVYARIDAKYAADPNCNFEGYVLSCLDDEGTGITRIKVKSKRYVELHHLGTTPVTLDRLISIVVAGESAEFLAAFPEHAGIIEAISILYTKIVRNSLEFYEKNKNLPKAEFAKLVSANIADVPISWICFDLLLGKINPKRIMMHFGENPAKICMSLRSLMIKGKG